MNLTLIHSVLVPNNQNFICIYLNMFLKAGRVQWRPQVICAWRVEVLKIKCFGLTTKLATIPHTTSASQNKKWQPLTYLRNQDLKQPMKP